MIAPQPEIDMARAPALDKAVALATGATSGVVVFAGIAGLTGSWALAVTAGVAGAALVAWYVLSKRLLPVDEHACSRPLLVVSAVTAVLAIVQLARLAVFMVDPSQVGYSMFPWSRWELRHSCLTAYYVAANVVEEVPDVYAESLYSLPNADPTAQRRPRTLGAFNIDVYEYPPPFLLLPRAVQLLTSDFTRVRAVWFAFNAGLVFFVLLAISRSLEPGVASRAVLLLPLVVLAFPTLGALQKGNVQLMIVALSMFAMLAFRRGRFAVGGAALGFAIVSKLYPALLVFYLLFRREWRPVAWTVAMGGACALLAVLDTGWTPFAAFVEHFPKLMSGEAFPAFRNPAAMATNLSIPGLVFKLKLLGVTDMSFGAAKVVGWGYTIIVLGAIAVLAMSTRPAHTEPFVWLAILILATLRSPFLPQVYGTFPGVWLLTMVGAAASPRRRTLVGVIAMWLVFHLYAPPDWSFDMRARLAVAILPQIALIGLTVLALRRYASSTLSSRGARSWMMASATR